MPNHLPGPWLASAASLRPASMLIWEFDNAPQNLRALVSPKHTGGWIAFIRPGESRGLVESLITYLTAGSPSVGRYDADHGGVVLAGAYPSEVDGAGEVA